MKELLDKMYWVVEQLHNNLYEDNDIFEQYFTIIVNNFFLAVTFMDKFVIWDSEEGEQYHHIDDRELTKEELYEYVKDNYNNLIKSLKLLK